MSEDKKAWILGISFENDGHKRLTRGENFVLAGGSEETHHKMTEGMIKFNEHLKRKGKKLEEVSKEEFTDLAHKSGLITDPKQN